MSHLERLDRIEDKISEADRAHVVDARSTAINGHMKTLQNLAKVNPVRAAEINLQAIQGRLNRAEAQAARGHGKRVEEALQEYERLRRFGEEISSSAQSEGRDTRAINEMNARATDGQLEALGSIYEQSSEETKSAVEQAMGVAVEEHGQAVQELEQQGAQGDIPAPPSLPIQIPDDVRKKIQGADSKGSGNGRR
ncbi:MAG: hypothetical protein ONB05_09385 [candidate division KSB1 bacterium]|nr:hypothetical protein [candidate division KSB1 bacterium]